MDILNGFAVAACVATPADIEAVICGDIAYVTADPMFKLKVEVALPIDIIAVAGVDKIVLKLELKLIVKFAFGGVCIEGVATIDPYN